MTSIATGITTWLCTALLIAPTLSASLWASVLFHRRRSPPSDSPKPQSPSLPLPPTSPATLHGLRTAVCALALCLTGPFLLLAGGLHAPIVLAALASLTISLLWLALSRRPWSTSSSMSPSAVSLKLALTAAVASTLAAFFFAVQRVIAEHARAPWDGTLLGMDEGILGWAFPRGQVALWVDRDPVVGPSSVVGRVVTEGLTIVYVSYYLWPYVVLAMLVARCLWSERRKGPTAEMRAWRAVEAFLCAWVGSFMLTFAINAMCPASSPRLFLAAEFQNRLDGIGLVRSLMGGVIHQDSTFGSFPSGHVGETLAVCLASHRLGMPSRLSYGLGAVTAMVAVATVWLRYHYFVDVVAAVVVAFVSVHLSRCGDCSISPCAGAQGPVLSPKKSADSPSLAALERGDVPLLPAL